MNTCNPYESGRPQGGSWMSSIAYHWSYRFQMKHIQVFCKSDVCLYFNNVTSVVSWCFKIFVLGFESTAKLKIVCLNSSPAMIIWPKKRQIFVPLPTKNSLGLRVYPQLYIIVQCIYQAPNPLYSSSCLCNHCDQIRADTVHYAKLNVLIQAF